MNQELIHGLNPKGHELDICMKYSGLNHEKWSKWVVYFFINHGNHLVFPFFFLPFHFLENLMQTV